MSNQPAGAQPVARNAATPREVDAWRSDSGEILIRAQGMELTEPLREAVIRKIGRVRQYAPRAVRVRVQLHRLHLRPSPHQFSAQVHFEIPGNDLVAEQRAHDPVAAIDLVAERIEGRLRRRKTARLSRRGDELRCGPGDAGVPA